MTFCVSFYSHSPSFFFFSEWHLPVYRETAKAEFPKTQRVHCSLLNTHTPTHSRLYPQSTTTCRKHTHAYANRHTCNIHCYILLVHSNIADVLSHTNIPYLFIAIVKIVMLLTPSVVWKKSTATDYLIFLLFSLHELSQGWTCSTSPLQPVITLSMNIPQDITSK